MKTEAWFCAIRRDCDAWPPCFVKLSRRRELVRASRAVLLFLCCSVLLLRADGPSPDAVTFFEMRVRPVLVRNCYQCHTESRMGNLQLDSREHVVKGGNSGPAIVPGNPEQSLLIQAVRRTHERIKMPPQGKLKDEEIADLVAWIGAGASWPATAGITVQTPEYAISPQQRAFWAFQPVHKPTLPEVRDKNWAQSPIDRFILVKLEQKGL